ncbi:prolyl oligopeptidase family serine peptidase [Marinoscillum furvescens]|uniref:prolyl oligopeptidase n=1 Tax=Marinoscillum furvescens DSM 4134 TaxID=1122208 RepID=A0A3D9LH04_MARFU|nr:prolyl oligopeptidase family serine peptidase [Marinoscillum furvescens]REE05898.1 prolyl oligopeptidase [Marinoscillum furvescens DSM 4134]
MKRSLPLWVLGLTMACSPKSDTSDAPKNLSYPETAKVDTVDTYFGTEVPDPYRWLEDDRSEETAEWVKAQNQVTNAYLSNIPYRDKIKNRLKTLFDYERVSAPEKYGEWEYFSKNDGLQNQSVLYRRKDANSEAEVFLDPNKFSEDGTISLGGSSFTEDGSLFAYAISIGGSDWRKILVMDTKTKALVGDTIHNVKFSGLSWYGNEGFYYSSYDKPKDGSELSGKTQFHKLYFHKLGTAQSDDQLVFGGEAQPYRYIFGSVTEDNRYLQISAASSTSGNVLFIKDLKDPAGKILTVDNNMETDEYIVSTDGERILIQTNQDAPNNKIVETSIGNPETNTWKDVIPESENVLSTSTGGGYIFANYLKDAQSVVQQFDLNGNRIREVELPAIGAVYKFGGKMSDETLYYTFTSFTYPSSIFKYDVTTGESILYEQPEIDFNPEDYVTKQVFYTSKDGTEVPMFIVHKKGLELNGKNATYLYAYGGFNVSLKPTFSTSRILWLENGGVYAQPNIRGGGEYGEKWHKAGTKMQKQNVFDDFIAAGEFLISEGYTSSDYLAIAGGSNGGLLVGATMTQRPDLAKVAFPAVGVMDMLRYHKFTAGAGWASDYGTSEDSKEMFDYLLGYSPVHNLKEGTSYPATMVTTADHDDRVVPAHSFKFAAGLQAAHAGDNPVLIRIETDAGHGAGTPISKKIDQEADKYAFAWYNMGVVPEIAKKDM